jgi:hypothetical protein
MQWHIAMLSQLNVLPGTVVLVDTSPGPGGIPASAQSLLQLDSLLTGTERSMTRPASIRDLAGFNHDGQERAGIILDLCGDVPAQSARVWRLTFDGAPGEGALLGSLLNGRSPVAVVSEAGRPIAVGRLGADNAEGVLAAFEGFLHRTTTLILAAFARGARALPAQPDGATPDDAAVATPEDTFTMRRLGIFAARRLSTSVIRHIYRLCYAAPHWRVGWRRLDGPDLYALRRHPETGWITLRDDYRRFYADPFPIDHDGRITLFVEEFPHGTSKGIISAAAFGREGPLETPRPVLELPYHLSYPFVFAREGHAWMVPESSASGTIDLFRATRFPGGWIKEATLVSGVVASDATLVEHGGRWWMFATVRDFGGSFSDSLYLWSAPDFRGPWTGHAANPVMIDIASARPAGRIVRRGEALFRPVQDCRHGYGAALGIARIVQLDEAGFSQTVETVITPGRKWGGSRIHTLNSEGGFEFIDGSARVLRRIIPTSPIGRATSSSGPGNVNSY